MKILDVVPSWLWALLLMSAVAFVGIERAQVLEAHAEVSKAQKALSDEKLDRQTENTRRAIAALEDLQRVLALQATHAQVQKENIDAYEKKLANLDSRRRAAAGDVERVRKQFADYAARDRDQAASDRAACLRVADRSAVLAGVAARGGELLERGRFVVEQRDAEVGVLVEIVRNDRNVTAK
ncbi:hypothetical protein [Variovorax sp. efr-133-TYG-130]|uniref:hypothetical protein n=1 Tax=Variovorax sp. efr-133-TYG-130 TaxID=3040327 RepID=UPI002552DC2C|nr:hypothetical protein [Variovorax sp. efr-133-TYG-130]